MPKVLGATLALGTQSCGANSVRLQAHHERVVEQIFSTLLAPSMMIFTPRSLLTTLIGKSVKLNAQDRGDRGITSLDAANRHKCTCCWVDLGRPAILVHGSPATSGG